LQENQFFLSSLFVESKMLTSIMFNLFFCLDAKETKDEGSIHF
jgi:hypothetical protein